MLLSVYHTHKHCLSYPLKVEFGFHSWYHVDRPEHELIDVKEGLLVLFEFRLELDVSVLQDQMQHKARVLIGPL